MTHQEPRLTPLGDSAIVVAFATDFDAAASGRVRALARAIARARLPAVIEVVPGYVALTVHYQPFETDFATLRDQIRSLADAAGSIAHEGALRTIVIPVRYDGPDLGEVADRTGLTPSEVVERHLGREYEVALLGFVPGFVYLTELDPALVLPRRETPRTRVPAGSVAIAGAQTGIYPAATPGGWHLIGTTQVRLFDPERQPPTLLAVGDRVRFEAEAG